MRPASVTSPFSAVDAGSDWIQWQKDQPLLCLQNKEQTDSRYFLKAAHEIKSHQQTGMPYIMPIQRPQYNAVLDRFSSARKRSGAFSAWTTT